MPWHAHLSLDYRLQGTRTVLQHRHDGPLRIFKSLYPEGDAVCHNVLVHPPGGLVGGDTLDIDATVGPGAHALVSTPGATRFYASDQAWATQQVRWQLAEGARLEWLPLETIAYPGCRADNRWTATLAAGAELMGWDVVALGLPGASQPFDTGTLRQRLALPGLWLEQARIDASDTRLLESPLGLAGRRCMGTLLFATGEPLDRSRREHLLDAARTALDGTPEEVTAAASCPHGQVLVVRAVAPLVEPVMTLFQQLWGTLRSVAWQLPDTPPRIWRV